MEVSVQITLLLKHCKEGNKAAALGMQ